MFFIHRTLLKSMKCFSDVYCSVFIQMMKIKIIYIVMFPSFCMKVYYAEGCAKYFHGKSGGEVSN